MNFYIFSRVQILEFPTTSMLRNSMVHYIKHSDSNKCKVCCNSHESQSLCFSPSSAFIFSCQVCEKFDLRYFWSKVKLSIPTLELKVEMFPGLEFSVSISSKSTKSRIFNKSSMTNIFLFSFNTEIRIALGERYIVSESVQMWQIGSGTSGFGDVLKRCLGYGESSGAHINTLTEGDT